MALSVGNIVLLAIGAILLVTGAARTAVYLVPPDSSPSAVYQWSPGPVQSTVARESADRIPSTRVPFQASSGNAGVAVPNTPLPRATPAAATPDSSPDVASRGMAGPTGSAEIPSPEAEMATAPATVPVAEAMAPLGDKFLRMWHWVQETGDFIYYDPQAPEESTLEAVASGRTYLILVTESVTLIVNGEKLELDCDDGDCWNKVVWP